MIKTIESSDNGLSILKSSLIDVLDKISKKQNDKTVFEANKKLDSIIAQIESCFSSGQKVRLSLNRKKDSEDIVFNSIDQLKVWLIKNQPISNFNLFLQRLKAYYKKAGDSLPEINIIFGDYEKKIIYNTDMYFNNTFRPEWLEDGMIQKVIKSVDKSEVINGSSINSPVFGTMPPQKLSGGVKTLMLIYQRPDLIFNASTCGDNCAKWIEKFAKEKDFVINLYHTMHFSEKNFKAYIVNADKVVDSYDEYVFMADKYCRGQE